MEGIFSAVLNDDLFRLTTSVEYIPPAELKIEAGDGKFFNTTFLTTIGGLSKVASMEASTSSHESMKVGGQIKIAPLYRVATRRNL